MSALDHLELLADTLTRVNTIRDSQPTRLEDANLTRCTARFNAYGMNLYADANRTSAMGMYAWLYGEGKELDVTGKSSVRVTCDAYSASSWGGVAGWIALIFFDSAGRRVGGTYRGASSTRPTRYTQVEVTVDTIPRFASKAVMLVGAENVRVGDICRFRNLSDAPGDPITAGRAAPRGYSWEWVGEEHNSATIERKLDVDLTPDLHRLAIDRGGQRDGLGFTVVAGRLECTLDGDLAGIIHPGDPFTVRGRGNNALRMMQGWFSDVDVSYAKPTAAAAGRRVTHLVGTDAVDSLANTMRYGARTRQSWAGRLTSYRNETWPAGVQDMFEYPAGGALLHFMPPIVLESSLATHLDLLARSHEANEHSVVGWYVNRTNRPVMSLLPNPASSEVVFTDGPIRDNPSSRVTYLHYSELQRTESTRDVTNDLRIVNKTYGTRPENPDEIIAFDMPFGPYVDAGSVARSRRRSNTFECSADGNIHDLEPVMADLAAGILARSAMETRFPSVTVPMLAMLEKTTNAAQRDNFCTIDVSNRASVYVDNVRQQPADTPLYIARIKHVITPDDWTATFHLER